MNGRRIAALDMGGTKIKGCLFEDGQMVQKGDIDSQARQGGVHFLEQAAALLDTFRPFDVLGISTAGQVDVETGVIRYANDNIPGYTGMDVKGFFEGRFLASTAVINDVYAAALGEGAHGAAKGERDYLCLTYGTGVGGAVVLGGQLYYGGGASAGIMLGGLMTHPEARVPGDAFSGTYERAASASALVGRAAVLSPAPDSGREIFSRLEEPQVCAVVDGWLDEVAAGLCSLIHIYNIPCVILGGGVMEQRYAIDGVRNRVTQNLIPGFRGVRILAAKLGNTAGLYGAASMAERL